MPSNKYYGGIKMKILIIIICVLLFISMLVLDYIVSKNTKPRGNKKLSGTDTDKINDIKSEQKTK